jgi:hypothetical protein
VFKLKQIKGKITKTQQSKFKSLDLEITKKMRTVVYSWGRREK